jgi:predicted nucleic acid-binding protein
VLYVDSSVFFKNYVQETGSDAIAARIEQERHSATMPFTSVISYAEIHAVFARKKRERHLSSQELARLQHRFNRDWAFVTSAIELVAGVQGYIPQIVSAAPLKGSDAIHLASALWLRDATRIGMFGRSENLCFATSDVRLAAAASARGLIVFNPETDPG